MAIGAKNVSAWVDALEAQVFAEPSPSFDKIRAGFAAVRAALAEQDTAGAHELAHVIVQPGAEFWLVGRLQKTAVFRGARDIIVRAVDIADGSLQLGGLVSVRRMAGAYNVIDDTLRVVHPGYDVTVTGRNALEIPVLAQLFLVSESVG